MSKYLVPERREAPVYNATDAGEQLLLWGEIVVDSDVILEGSNAEEGVVIGGMPAEIYCGSGYTKSDNNTVEIYPLDGRDRPVEVEVRHFDITDPGHVRGVVSFAIGYRGQLDTEGYLLASDY